MSQEQKEYPKSEIFERAYLLKLYYNPHLADKYLDQTLPATFFNRTIRVMIYLFKRLKDKGLNLSIDSLSIISQKPDESMKAFLKKHKVAIPSTREMLVMLNETSIVDTSDELFEEAREQVLKLSFARFVEDILSEVKWYNGYTNEDYHSQILSRFKAGAKIHDLIYSRTVNKRDMYAETQFLINSENEYIPTSSQVLNSYIGGFTRGYVDAIIAKSSHGKSSWADFNIAQNIFSGKVRKVIKITPEEDAGTQLRRYLAMILKMPTSAMRLKTVKITDEHIKILKEKLAGRLEIHDRVNKYKDIIDLMHSVKFTDMIWVDHINSIDYPGNGSYLANMIGNIPGLIGAQKLIAKEKNIVIVNLSQVGDKEIQKSDRLNKAPRYFDAYGSSVLFQASREYLSLWYPYKDWEDSVIHTGNIPSINDIQISIEKSSFSKVGKLMVHFDPEFNLFADKSQKALKKLDYVAPQEEMPF